MQLTTIFPLVAIMAWTRNAADAFATTKASSVATSYTRGLAPLADNEPPFSVPKRVTRKAISRPENEATESSAPIEEADVGRPSDAPELWTTRSARKTRRGFWRPDEPFIVNDIDCHNEADFRGHADIHSGAQKEGIDDFCDSERGQRGTLDVVAGTAPFRIFRSRYNDRRGINHDFEVRWAPGCETQVDEQSVQWPLGEGKIKCADIMRANWEKCNNGGVGGSTKVGCLVYTYSGGRG